MTYRKIKSKDVIIGKKIFILGDDGKYYSRTIIEILCPNDRFKAFICDDGCRYGLEDTFVV